MFLRELFLYFLIYSFLGYLWETVFCTITHKKYENRGMLFGPWCPIYGVGAVLEIVIIGDMQGFFKVFLLCALGSRVLEYSTSYLTEKFFHAVWWDYSNKPFNIHGRICLEFTLCFGLRGLLVRYILQPRISWLVGLLSPIVREGLALVLMALFAGDVAITVDCLVGINVKISDYARNYDARLTARVDEMFGRARDRKERREEQLEAFRKKAREKELEEQSRRLRNTFGSGQLRLIRQARRFSYDNNQRGSLLSRINQDLQQSRK